MVQATETQFRANKLQTQLKSDFFSDLSKNKIYKTNTHMHTGTLTPKTEVSQSGIATFKLVEKYNAAGYFETRRKACNRYSCL